jgi:hypothetical protein
MTLRVAPMAGGEQDERGDGRYFAAENSKNSQEGPEEVIPNGQSGKPAARPHGSVSRAARGGRDRQA